MKILILIIASLSLFCTISRCQEKVEPDIPVKFIESISRLVGNPMSSGLDSIDMYTIGILLNPEGQVLTVYYSEGMPDDFKELFRDELSRLMIGTETLETYWRKFCKKESIQHRKLIIQSAMVRCDETDSLTFSASQIEEKFRKAMTFSQSIFQYAINVSFIWLNPVIKWRPREQLVE